MARERHHWRGSSSIRPSRSWTTASITSGQDARRCSSGGRRHEHQAIPWLLAQTFGAMPADLRRGRHEDVAFVPALVAGRTGGALQRLRPEGARRPAGGENGRTATLLTLKMCCPPCSRAVSDGGRGRWAAVPSGPKVPVWMARRLGLSAGASVSAARKRCGGTARMSPPWPAACAGCDPRLSRSTFSSGGRSGGRAGRGRGAWTAQSSPGRGRAPSSASKPMHRRRV